jgi:hypothetical protein
LSPNNWDILKTYKKNILQEEVSIEEVKESPSNIADILEVSEVDSSLKDKRFETE